MNIQPLNLIVSFLLLLLLTSISTVESDVVGSSQEQKIQDYMEYLYDNNIAMLTMAVSVAATADETTTTAEAAAAEEEEEEIPGLLFHHQVGLALPRLEADSATQYRIGSITKTFVAVMILQLIEEGRLALDTTLSQFFPNIPNADNITVEHMLRHRSGLFSFTNDDSCWSSWCYEPQTREDMLARLENYPLSFEPPDSKFEYSNSNYLLLGYIIEDVSGNGYGLELQDRIVNTLNLTRTSPMTFASEEDNVALSFEWRFNQWTAVNNETDPSVPGGAGNIMSTALDLIMFIEGLFKGKLINKTSLETMIQPIDGYGMGILPMDNGFGHSGGIDRFGSLLMYIPEEKLAMAIIVNGINEAAFDEEEVFENLYQLARDPDFEVMAPPSSSGAVAQYFTFAAYWAFLLSCVSLFRIIY